MWIKRSWLLYVGVRLRGVRPRFRLHLSISMSVLHQLLLSCDCLSRLLPGKAGYHARMSLDTAHTVLLGMMDTEPQNYVHVDVGDKEKHVLVDVKTIGWKVGEDE